AVIGLSFLSACKRNKTATEPDAAAQQSSAPIAAEYQKLLANHFPKGAALIGHAIDKKLLRAGDEENNMYVEARLNNQSIGFARPWQGPVSSESDCPCNPLHLVLVFNAD